MLIIEIALGIVFGLWLSRNWTIVVAKSLAGLKYAFRLILWSVRVLFILTPIGVIAFLLHYNRSTFPKAYVRAYFVP